MGVRLIIARSNACIDKLSKVFPDFISGEKEFHEYFQTLVDDFRARTKDWEESRILSLSDDNLHEKNEN